VLDVELPGRSGFDLQQELEWSEAQLLGIPRPTLEPKRASLAIDIDSFRSA
jgi:hypothetical protein